MKSAYSVQAVLSIGSYRSGVYSIYSLDQDIRLRGGQTIHAEQLEASLDVKGFYYQPGNGYMWRTKSLFLKQHT